MVDEINMVRENPDNKVVGVVSDEYSIIFVVSERTEAQKNIPSVIDGREVKVLPSL